MSSAWFSVVASTVISMSSFVTHHFRSYLNVESPCRGLQDRCLPVVDASSYDSSGETSLCDRSMQESEAHSLFTELWKTSLKSSVKKHATVCRVVSREEDYLRAKENEP